MDRPVQLLVFVLAQQHFAVLLGHVRSVIAAVQVTPVPGAPDLVLGIIDLHGEIVPVLDLRRRMGHARPAVSVDDQFVLVQCQARTLALLANHCVGVVQRQACPAHELGMANTGARHFEGATIIDDGLVLIHDIERFLTPGEASTLDALLEQLR